MKTYSYKDYPFRLDGVPFYEERGQLRRYNDEIIEKHPRLADFDTRLTGARLRFAIKGSHLRVKILTENVYSDIGMSFFQANSATLMLGDYSHSEFSHLLTNWEQDKSEGVWGETDLPDERTEVTVYLLRNPIVTDIIIETDDEAELYPPAAYSFGKPFVFYGSSITEYGLTQPKNGYASILSRMFDADFYNFGASGNARGEIEVCDHLSKLDMSIFFMDYDYNAPDSAWLKSTHRQFFERFRMHHPDTPVIMTSRPADDNPEYDERRQIVRATYVSAIENGDNNVYFIDGDSFFEGYDRALCTADRTHPNDLGHYLMAQKIATVVSLISGRKPAGY